MNVDALLELDSAPALQHLVCTPSLDLLMVVLSTAAEGWFLVPVAIGLAWKANRDPRGGLQSAMRFLTILAVTGALVAVTKRIVDMPRPLTVLGPERVRVLLQPLHRMSFPSGHSALAAATALWALREPSAWTRWWPWLFAFLCGVSRVYVGAHWVTDVVGGWLLGLVAAAAVCRVWPPPRRASVEPAAAGPEPAVAAVATEVTEVTGATEVDPWR